MLYSVDMNIMLSGTGGTLGHPDFFLILDRLYGTLGDKFDLWKKQNDKCTGFIGGKKKSENRKKLWNERLIAMHDVSSAMKYIHQHE